MNFFKRAMASVTRRKGKSLILFAVIFILGNVMAGAIAIDQGTKNVENTIKSKLGAVATISEDYEKMQKDMGENSDATFEPNLPTPKILKEIGELEEVKYFDYVTNYGFNTKKLKMVQSKNEDMQFTDPGMNFINIKGINYKELFDIKNNIITLSDGRVFEQAEIDKGKPVVIISDELAKENNLRVGDKMTIDATIQDNSSMMNGEDSESEESTSKEVKVAKKDFQVEVIGTFKVLQAEKEKKAKNKDDKMMADMTYTERVNSVYSSNQFVNEAIKTMQIKEFEEFPGNFDESMTKEKLLKTTESDFGGSAKFILKKPEMAEEFKIKANQILEKNKLKYSRVILSTDQYEQVAGPVKGMSKISKLVLIISVLASILIITLVTILFLRDRKHELGIYLSLGEKRTRVIGQIVLEVVTVAFIAITISVFTGNMLAKGFSNSMMQTQKTEQSESNTDYQLDYELSQLTNNSVSEDDVVEAYQISLNAKYVILFYVVGVGVVLISTVAPLIYIMRLNPKKIMM